MSALARGKAFVTKNHVVVGNRPILKPSSRGSIIPSRRSIHIAQLSALNLLKGANFFSTPMSALSKSVILANQLLSSQSIQKRTFATSPYQSKTVLLPTEVDSSKFILGAPKKNAKGGQFIAVNYGGEFKTLRVQTPIARIPFGLQSYESGGYSVQIALENPETNSGMQKFVEMVQKVDELILAEALKSNKIWFAGKGFTPDIIKNNFTRNVKEGKEGFSPLMKLKIPIVKGQPDVEVYMESEAAPIEALEPPNNSAVAIIEPRSIWFVGGKFGISWIVRQIKVLERKNRLPSNAFRDDVPELQNRSKTAPVSPNPRPPVVTQSVEKDLDVENVDELNVQSVDAEFVPADSEVEPEYPAELDEETVLGEEAPKEAPKQAKPAPNVVPTTAQKLSSSPPLKQTTTSFRTAPVVDPKKIGLTKPVAAAPTKPSAPAKAPVKPTAPPAKPASAPAKTTVPPTKAAPTKAASPVKRPLK